MARYRRDVIVTIIGVGATLAVLNLVIPKHRAGSVVVEIAPPAHAAHDCGAVSAGGDRAGRGEGPKSDGDFGAASQAERCAPAAH
ncbi:MAG: hypothetical protein ACXWU2_09790 [Allosphingosinicella sp.]